MRDRLRIYESMECIRSEKESQEIEWDEVMDSDLSPHEKYNDVHCSKVDEIGVKRYIRRPDIILSDNEWREIGSENTKCEYHFRLSQ